jgi:hypothetical protein
MRAISIVLLLGCGAASSAPSGGGGEASSGGAAPMPDPEIDPQVCATDDDCMIGTPRNCCAAYCTMDAVAWSRTAWDAYQDECAVVECASREEPACLPETPPPMVARCLEERCVLLVGEAAGSP